MVLKSRMDIYFTNDDEKKEFQELAKKHGFRSFGAFAKASMIFYDRFYEHYCKMIDIHTKLDMKLDDLHVKTVESSEKIESELDAIREYLSNYISGHNILELKDKFYIYLIINIHNWFS